MISHGQDLLMCNYGVITELEMGTLTVRIPDDLRRRMKRIKGVNWSEVVRDAIMERVMLEERIGKKNWRKVRMAVKKIDQIRESMERRYGRSGYDSVELIRQWREARIWREQ